jgi:hypothetical protein
VFRSATPGPSVSFFKKFNGVDDASSALNISKKNDASPTLTQNPVIVVAGKTWFVMFSPKNSIFNQF